MGREWEESCRGRERHVNMSPCRGTGQPGEGYFEGRKREARGVEAEMREIAAYRAICTCSSASTFACGVTRYYAPHCLPVHWSGLVG